MSTREEWLQTLGEMLQLIMEATNPHDQFAVALITDGMMVGRVPRQLSKAASLFLEKAGSAGLYEVTGS